MREMGVRGLLVYCSDYPRTGLRLIVRCFSVFQHLKFISHGQRCALVAFERDLLCEHYVTNGKMTLGYKAPANVAAFVQLIDIHTGCLGYPVSAPRMAADHLEIALRLELV